MLVRTLVRKLQGKFASILPLEQEADCLTGRAPGERTVREFVMPKHSSTPKSWVLAVKPNWTRATRSKPATNAAKNAVARSCSACSSCSDI